MPFGTGNTCSSSERMSCSSSNRVRMSAATVRRHVICWKSAYLTFSVTVLPQVLAFSQLYHSFSIIG